MATTKVALVDHWAKDGSSSSALVGLSSQRIRRVSLFPSYFWNYRCCCRDAVDDSSLLKLQIAVAKLPWLSPTILDTSKLVIL